jgi:hypothetical protein
LLREGELSMAFHSSVAGLLRESIPEYLEITRYCIANRRPDGASYGYPPALLMLTIVDVIGSYHEGSDYVVQVEGAARRISKRGAEHYLVLNDASYYNQQLTWRQIEEVYEEFRCLLAHNASLAPGRLLACRDDENGPLIFTDDNGTVEALNLRAFLALTERAVGRFLNILDELTRQSTRAKRIMARPGPWST